MGAVPNYNKHLFYFITINEYLIKYFLKYKTKLKFNSYYLFIGNNIILLLKYKLIVCR